MGIFVLVGLMAALSLISFFVGVYWIIRDFLDKSFDANSWWITTSWAVMSIITIKLLYALHAEAML